MKWYLFDNTKYLSPIYPVDDKYWFCAVYFLKDKYHDSNGYGWDYYEYQWIANRKPLPFIENLYELIHAVFEYDIPEYEPW